MPKSLARRKQLFRAALALADLTAERWAQEHGITASYLSHILSGNRESEDIDAEIEAFTKQYLRKHTAQVA